MTQLCGAVFHNHKGEETLCTLEVHHEGEHNFRRGSWSLSTHVDGDGRNWAILHEQGKMDMTKEIPADLLPFFNALKNLLAKSAEEPRP